ncbi:YicC/YloC family endoribonuclease [Gudongella sp. DL1XJH-153]|uniref:YicC/YloC family endoribonuclease n=1 Tax=Gudongella sp. DL1XJH-153 TaxID=3409804 RepID=UPI003BB5E91F
MIRSMTGYGKGESENQLYKLKIELKSVNHRYLDINVKLPRYLIYLEESIKKLIKERMHRGKVDVFVNFEFAETTAVDVKVDISLARSFKSALEELKSELDIDDSIRLNNILSISDVIKTEKKELDEDLVWEAIKESTIKALDKMIAMREYEGEQLRKDIHGKLGNIESIATRIEERAPLVVEEYKSKLNERIQAILEDVAAVDMDRLAMEIAIYADKSSIDEELTRLKSHVSQLKEILSEKDSIGRKLDFLIQEFNREVNTIGSKSSDTDIVKAVVELKSEIEKIREQVQNIE